MTRLIPVFVAGLGIGAYQAVAVKTHRVPPITQIVHATRLHFQPACPQCGVKVLGSRRPQYRGWHTARVS